MYSKANSARNRGYHMKNKTFSKNEVRRTFQWIQTSQ